MSEFNASAGAASEKPAAVAAPTAASAAPASAPAESSPNAPPASSSSSSSSSAAAAAAAAPSSGSVVGSSSSDEQRVANLVKIDNLAASQYRSGNFKEAADLLRRALSIREEFMAGDDIDLLNNVNNLAASLGRLKKFDEAETLFRRVLKGREDKLGADHMDTLVTANHLGVVVKQQMKLAEAEPLLQRALVGLQKLETALPANGLLYAEAAYNYAVLCVQMGKRKKASVHFRIAHQRLEKALGAENPHTLDALHWEIKCMQNNEFAPATTAGSAGAGSEAGASAAASASAESDNLLGNGSGDDEEVYHSQKTWVNAPTCELCSRTFTTVTMVRPHHCRICARCVCDPCSKGKTVTREFGMTTPVRCCDLCEQQGF